MLFSHLFCLALGFTILVKADHVTHINSNNYQQTIADTNKPLVIDVFAHWCQPCKVMKPIFDQFAQEYAAKYACAEVDIDESADIVQTFKVATIPAFVVMHNKHVIGKVIGSHDAETLKMKIDEIIRYEGKSLKELPKEILAQRFFEALQTCAYDDLSDLIDAGIDVNEPTKDGSLPLITALSNAARFGEPGVKVLQLLLHKGASTTKLQLPGLPQPIAARDLVLAMINNARAMVTQYEDILALVGAAQQCSETACPVKA